MNFKDKKMIFFYVAILLFILAQIFGNLFSWPSILVIIAPFLLLISVVLFVYGGLNYTKLKLWLKIILTIIATPIVSVILFLLMWGINTGFKFTF